MIPSLRTPKQRIELPSGTAFFNDFANTLHMNRGEDESYALAVNVGKVNWTVSEKDELIFFTFDGENPVLMLIDTVKKTRKKIAIPEQFNITDIIITADRFFAAIPGLLVMGSRNEEGDLIWKKMRMVARGAGFRFRLEDDGRLAYTLRGTCSVFRFDPQTHKTEETPTPEQLWQMLFRADFKPEYMPDFPGGGFPSIKELTEAFENAAAGHNVTKIGTNAYSMLSYVNHHFEGDTADILDRLFALDWDLQYTALIDEPFPSILLLHKLYQYRSIDELPATRLLAKKITRWSRIFETDRNFARHSRPVRSKEFTDI